jgi:hypothetical protein
MIATRAEIKTLLGISSTNYDARIDSLRQIVQDDLVRICNNDFFLRQVYVKGSDIKISTSTGAGDKITHGSARFKNTVDGGEFVASRDIVIHGSRANDGHYELSAVSSGVLTLATSGGSVVAESTGELMTVAQVRWPEGLKPYYAQMIWNKIDKAKGSIAKSETIDDYSITYADGSHGYPNTIINGLKSAGYVKARMS